MVPLPSKVTDKRTTHNADAQAQGEGHTCRTSSWLALVVFCALSVRATMSGRMPCMTHSSWIAAVLTSAEELVTWCTASVARLDRALESDGTPAGFDGPMWSEKSSNAAVFTYQSFVCTGSQIPERPTQPFRSVRALADASASFETIAALRSESRITMHICVAFAKGAGTVESAHATVGCAAGEICSCRS